MNGIECALFGRVGTEPELRVSAAGKPWARLSVAVAVGQDEDVEWIQLIAFGELAEELPAKLHKGDRLYAEGRLKVLRWQKDGAERSRLEVVAWRIERIAEIGRNKPRRPRRDADSRASYADGARTTLLSA
jgi:single-strand DNA-binding protein